MTEELNHFRQTAIPVEPIPVDDLAFHVDGFRRLGVVIDRCRISQAETSGGDRADAFKPQKRRPGTVSWRYSNSSADEYHAEVLDVSHPDYD